MNLLTTLTTFWRLEKLYWSQMRTLLLWGIPTVLLLIFYIGTVANWYALSGRPETDAEWIKDVAERGANTINSLEIGFYEYLFLFALVAYWRGGQVRRQVIDGLTRLEIFSIHWFRLPMLVLGVWVINVLFFTISVTVFYPEYALHIFDDVNWWSMPVAWFKAIYAGTLGIMVISLIPSFLSFAVMIGWRIVESVIGAYFAYSSSDFSIQEYLPYSVLSGFSSTEAAGISVLIAALLYLMVFFVVAVRTYQVKSI